MRRLVFAALLPFTLFACGDDSAAPGPDAAAPDGCHHVCGNGQLECGEQCDDMNNNDGDGCSHDCKIECGDGVKQAGEKCDTAIPAGMPGACPTSCDDTNPCTTDSISGSECQQECVHGSITACQNSDSCCPVGCTSGNDNDCSASCGNGVVDQGETCDTGITSGTGKCPTLADCNDNQACTTDSITNDGTCTAVCANTPITACTNGDGCCPSGCTHATDTDCAATCGNGTVDQGETCDTAITSGTGKCPTLADCNDNNACTHDSLVSGGTCMAACSNVTITSCTNSDGCCASGCNSLNDNDCQPRCGNGVIEAGEQCDDGNTNANDGCSPTCQLEPTAFRVTQAFIRDPHIFVLVLGLLCSDVTDGGATTSANGQLNQRITSDTMPMDGFYDLSILAVFNPLQQGMMTNPIELITQSDCTVATSSTPTTCRPHAGATIVNGTATNHSSGSCLGILPGTVHPYNPPVTVPSAPCFDSDSHDITLPVAGAMITLHGSRAGATYSGNPATQLINGEIRGFLTEMDANMTTVMISAINYNGPLSGLLPGGNGNCQSGYSDKDTGPDANGNTVPGWWFYVNFTAQKVPFTP